jgi:hypothetical protein
LIISEEPSGGDKKKQKAPKTIDNPLSRIPGLRDASKRTAKIVSVNTPLKRRSNHESLSALLPLIQLFDRF